MGRSAQRRRNPPRLSHQRLRFGPFDGVEFLPTCYGGECDRKGNEHEKLKNPHECISGIAEYRKFTLDSSGRQ